MIPQTFDQWRSCIENQCGIRLTKHFAKHRLAVFRNAEHPETLRFIEIYGKNHLQNIINWYSVYEH